MHQRALVHNPLTRTGQAFARTIAVASLARRVASTASRVACSSTGASQVLLGFAAIQAGAVSALDVACRSGLHQYNAALWPEIQRINSALTEAVAYLPAPHVVTALQYCCSAWSWYSCTPSQDAQTRSLVLVPLVPWWVPAGQLLNDSQVVES